MIKPVQKIYILTDSDGLLYFDSASDSKERTNAQIPHYENQYLKTKFKVLEFAEVEK